MGRTKWLVLLVAVCLFALVAVTAYAVPVKINPQGELTIVCMDVGEAAATLVIGPPMASGRRKAALIDAGGYPVQSFKDGGDVVADVLRDYKVKELEWVIITHYDADHLGGVVSGGAKGEGFRDGVAAGTSDDITIRHFVDRGSEKSSATFSKYAALAGEAGDSASDRRWSIAGEEELTNEELTVMRLGEGAEAPVLRCIGANGLVLSKTGDPVEVEGVSSENEHSLCLLLTYRDFDFLLCGDITGKQRTEHPDDEGAPVERAVGEYIHGAPNPRKIEALQVNHHGSDSASEESFLSLIRPRVAVISVGPSTSHKLPHRLTLDRLSDRTHLIYQTEPGKTAGEPSAEALAKQRIANGNLVITTNGKRYEIWAPRTGHGESEYLRNWWGKAR